MEDVIDEETHFSFRFGHKKHLTMLWATIFKEELTLFFPWMFVSFVVSMTHAKLYRMVNGSEHLKQKALNKPIARIQLNCKRKIFKAKSAIRSWKRSFLISMTSCEIMYDDE